MKRIAIVGGGCSAAIVVLHLLKKSEIPCYIEIFDPSDSVGLGVAYSTSDPLHCLNVPASRMGAFADKPEDFFYWLQENGYPHQGGEFVPRVVFAKYLTSRLEELLRAIPPNSKFIHTKKGVCRISKTQGTTNLWSVVSTDGSEGKFDDVVLALGLPEGGWPRGIKGFEEAIKEKPSVFTENVWDNPLGDNLSDKTVGILGTGLTAIDLAMSILSHDTNARVVLVSRHGLLPNPHFTEAAPPVPRELAQFSGGLREVVRKFRGLCKNYRWDAVIDALRPNIPALWSSWSSREREMFSRHLRHVWDVHRHRMAPHIAAQISEWRASGRIQVESGRISEISIIDDQIRLSLRERQATSQRPLLVDRLLNCTGFRTLSHSDYHGLLHQMKADNLVTLDRSGSGVEPNPPLSLSLHPGLYIMGALLRTVRWESIAVPELREQAREIVRQILDISHG